MEPTTDPVGGACLCGQVKFELGGRLRPVVYCHCEQCRKTSGHFVAATAVDPDQLTLLQDSGLRWFRSSDMAERGFCNNCGSSLFWRPDHGGYISVMAGCLHSSGDLKAVCHIFVGNAGGYYSIDDGLPQYSEHNPEVLGWPE